jgi:hypothetical protein
VISLKDVENYAEVVKMLVERSRYNDEVIKIRTIEVDKIL